MNKRKIGAIIMIALTLYLETGEEYGGYVIQMDYWRAQDGRVWVSRNGEPPYECGPNPKYLYTTFRTGSNDPLIPKYQPETEKGEAR